MRPVNLLPGEHRPREVSGERSGSAYVVVGVLAAMLVMALLYVLTANQVSSRKDEAAKAQQQAEEAQRQITALGPFGNFSEIKKVRIASVKNLADARFDWERFLRELAHIVPENAWFSEVDAATSDEARAGEGSSSATAGGQPVTGPSANLTGCAKDQPDVATLMVRARQLHLVTDVQLIESTAASGGSGATAGASTSGGGSCPPGYNNFKLLVAFEAASSGSTDAPERVPASLGGGS